MTRKENTAPGSDACPAFVVTHSANMLNAVALLSPTAGDVRDKDPDLRDRR
jgi:hypothetical protein